MSIYLGNTPITGRITLEDFVDAFYPVGSLYFGNTATCPIASIKGTWTLVSSGRAIMGADSSHAIGTTAEAGLPNITGDVGKDTGIGHVSNVSFGISVKDTQCSGAFYPNNNCTYTATKQAQQGSDGKSLGFDASRSSSIYGNSSTVQPPAYYVNIWERTA